MGILFEIGTVFGLLFGVYLAGQIIMGVFELIWDKINA